ncbi:MAG: hypothetical protein P8X74_13760 [Reinekea sp.]
MLAKNWGEPMGVPAIFEKQIEIKLLHSASTEGVTDSGGTYEIKSVLDFRRRHETVRNFIVPIGGSANYCHHDCHNIHFVFCFS